MEEKPLVSVRKDEVGRLTSFVENGKISFIGEEAEKVFSAERAAGSMFRVEVTGNTEGTGRFTVHFSIDEWELRTLLKETHNHVENCPC